jgi:hypothetical protein
MLRLGGQNDDIVLRPMIYALGHILFFVGFPAMALANLYYIPRINGDVVPYHRQPGYQPKRFALWSQFGVFLVLGLVILFGTRVPTGKVAHPDWWLLGYSMVVPILHIVSLKRLQSWADRR